jgi:hypothetical protein
VLVGASRIRVVRDLAEAWETAVSQRRVGVVVVEGPTGIGKTAIVQGLYELLAMRQARPAYWAATFAAASAPIPDSDDVIARQARRCPPSPCRRIGWVRARCPFGVDERLDAGVRVLGGEPFPGGRRHLRWLEDECT